MNTKPYRCAIGGMLAFIAILCNSPPSLAQSVIRYGVDTERNINALALVVAEREGFFAREGIRIERVRFPLTGDRPTDRELMINSRDKFDMTRVQTTFLIEEVFRGANFAAVAGVVNNPAYFMVARPEIKTVAELKGKSLAVTIPNDGITMTAQKILAAHGLKEGDVEIKDIGGSGPRVACLKSGACAAASLSQPSVFEAWDAGFHTLAMHKEVGSYVYVVDMVDRSWAEAHSETLTKYVRATAAAFRFIHDSRNRDAVVRAAMEQAAQPEQRARQMLDYYWDPKNEVLPQQGEINMDGLKAMIGLLNEFGMIKAPLPAPERFVDLRYLRAAGIP